jgi:hypothetical protein
VAAIHAAGLLPDGKPARVFACYIEGEYGEVTDDLLPGHNKVRCESLLLDAEIQLEPIMEELAATAWGRYQNTMLYQLMRWVDALKRPLWCQEVVGYSLYEALKLQGGAKMKVGSFSDLSLLDQVQFHSRTPAPKPNVTRQHQVDFRAPNGQRDTFPLVADRMNNLVGLSFLTANTTWQPRQIAGAYSAKAALEHYYNAIKTDYGDPEKLTHGIIDCYRWGMEEAVAVNPSAMVYTMEDRSGKLTAQKSLSTFENQLRTSLEAKAQYTPGAAFDGSRRDADGAGPTGHEKWDASHLRRP